MSSQMIKQYSCPTAKHHLIQDKNQFKQHLYYCRDAQDITVFVCSYSFYHMFLSYEEKIKHEQECPMKEGSKQIVYTNLADNQIILGLRHKDEIQRFTMLFDIEGDEQLDDSLIDSQRVKIAWFQNERKKHDPHLSINIKMDKIYLRSLYLQPKQKLYNIYLMLPGPALMKDNNNNQLTIQQNSEPLQQQQQPKPTYNDQKTLVFTSIIDLVEENIIDKLSLMKHNEILRFYRKNLIAEYCFEFDFLNTARDSPDYTKWKDIFDFMDSINKHQMVLFNYQSQSNQTLGLIKLDTEIIGQCIKIGDLAFCDFENWQNDILQYSYCMIKYQMMQQQQQQQKQSQCNFDQKSYQDQSNFSTQNLQQESSGKEIEQQLVKQEYFDLCSKDMEILPSNNNSIQQDHIMDIHQQSKDYQQMIKKYSVMEPEQIEKTHIYYESIDYQSEKQDNENCISQKGNKSQILIDLVSSKGIIYEKIDSDSSSYNQLQKECLDDHVPKCYYCQNQCEDFVYYNCIHCPLCNKCTERKDFIRCKKCALAKLEDKKLKYIQPFTYTIN